MSFLCFFFLVLLADTPVVAWHVQAVGVPASDSQLAFEVLPPSLEIEGWLGADSDVSVLVSGGFTGRRLLWVFADTVVARYNATSKSRLLPFKMPRNSLAVSQCTPTECNGPPQFSMRKDSSGELAPAMFGGAGKHGEEALWPVAAIASRDGRRVLLIAQRCVELTLQGFASISLEVGDSDDASLWNYSIQNVSGPELTWFSGITYAYPEDHNDDMTYLFGHTGRPNMSELDRRLGSQSGTVLSRARLSALLNHDWSGLEFWSQGSLWRESSENLLVIGVPTWETTCRWSKGLSRWYTFDLSYPEQGGAAIDMWTAEHIIGPWAKTAAVMPVPPPFNGTAVVGQPDPSYLCYAAKAHPEMLATNSSAGSEELILSYVCNSWPTDKLVSELFQTGGMEMPIRGYWPRFIKVFARIVAEERIDIQV